MAKKNTIKELIKENVDCLLFGSVVGACLAILVERRERIAYQKGLTSKVKLIFKEDKN